MKAILGCFRTTFEFESALAPPHLHLQRKILQSFTRLQTLPEKHSVYPHLEEACLSTYPVHTSPLDYLFKAFPQYSTTPNGDDLPFSETSVVDPIIPKSESTSPTRV